MEEINKEKIEEIIFSGKIYDPVDKRIFPIQQATISLVNKYNKTKNNKLGFKKRDRLLKKMFGGIGEACYIEPPMHANFGFSHVYFGSNVYANFNLTCVDDGKISVGDNTLIGPNVTIITACHPASIELRKNGYQYNKDVHIGRNAWIGSNVIIMPGVSIGDNSIIGAGSLVTKDIPSNVIAFGAPAKVQREITKDDEIYYDHGKKIEILKF